MCVYYSSNYYKAVRVGGGGDSGGHVLRESTSRGLCGLGCPSRTSERGGEGDCVKEGGDEKGSATARERDSARGVCLLLQYLLQSCSRGGGGNNGGHVLRETTSRGLCGLVCPQRNSERVCVCVCITAVPIMRVLLLLQYLIQSCALGVGERFVVVVCYCST